MQKARFHFLIGDRDLCLNVLKELCHRQPPITDEIVLRRLYTILAASLPESDATSIVTGNDLTKLWQSAIESQPGSKAKLLDVWIESALSLDRWEDIQQAVQQVSAFSILYTASLGTHAVACYHQKHIINNSCVMRLLRMNATYCEGPIVLFYILGGFGAEGWSR